jgi:hypothetical protein
LGGLQALVANRNSFSKWIVQFCPVPVIVVKPEEKRVKKKEKRMATRNEYVNILKNSGRAEHEISAESLDNTLFEIPNPPEVEARAVASAIGLPAPLALPTGRGASPTSGGSILSPYSQPSSPGIVEGNPKDTSSKRAEGGSKEESSDEETSYWDTTDSKGALALEVLKEKQKHLEMEQERKKKLHGMEMDEAATLAQAVKAKKAREEKAGRPIEEDYEDEEGDGTETPKPEHQHDGSGGSPSNTANGGNVDGGGSGSNESGQTDESANPGQQDDGSNRLPGEMSKPSRDGSGDTTNPGAENEGPEKTEKAGHGEEAGGALETVDENVQA